MASRSNVGCLNSDGLVMDVHLSIDSWMLAEMEPFTMLSIILPGLQMPI